MVCTGALHKSLLHGPTLRLLSWGLNTVRLSRRQILCGGILVALLMSASIHSSTASTHGNPLRLADVPSELSDEASVPTMVEERIHLYGESPQLDTVGASYLVFTAQDNQVTGAIFMPYSSFDCFEGQLGRQTLALEIRNSYTQELHTYAIALETEGTLANSAGGAFSDLHLDGFHNLGEPRESELSILAVCTENTTSQSKVEI